MQGLDNWRKATQDYAEAKKYIEKNGKMPTHCTTNTRGTLHAVKVETMIHFQPSDGAKNYHNCQAFDDALAEIIKINFVGLAEKAMGLLIDRCKDNKLAAQDEYRQMFNEVLKMEKNNEN